MEFILRVFTVSLCRNVPNLSVSRRVFTKAVKIQECKTATLCAGVCTLARILLRPPPLSARPALLYYVTPTPSETSEYLDHDLSRVLLYAGL